MVAELLYKRDQCVLRMWASLATAEFAVGAACRIHVLHQGATLILIFTLLICGLGISAILNYAFACEFYMQAKANKNASGVAGAVLLFSLLTSVFFTLWALVFVSAHVAYFAFPSMFALGALLLKLLPDRAKGIAE